MSTETTPVNQSNIDYFLNNFSEEGLRYIRSDLMRDMEFRRREIAHMENEIKRLQDRLQWFKDGMEGQRQELKEINHACWHFKQKSLEVKENNSMIEDRFDVIPLTYCMNAEKEEVILDSHQQLTELVQKYNNFEITVHDWESVLHTIKNLEKEFAFLPKTELELLR